MKNQIQVRTRTPAHSKNAHIIEHTPIYDLAAFEQRLKKRNSQKYIRRASPNLYGSANVLHSFFRGIST